MDKNIINFKTAKIKCNICPKGCLKQKALSDVCIENLGLDIESIAQKTFDAEQTASEIYNDFISIKKISDDGKFNIVRHMKKLRFNGQEKDLNKIMEYLEEKSLFKNKSHDEQIQLIMIDADSTTYKNTNLLICADCAPYLYQDFQKSYLYKEDDWAIILFCPEKQNAKEEYIEKLAYIFENNGIKSILVMQTETECCTEVSDIVKKALTKAQRIIPWNNLTISISGELV